VVLAFTVPLCSCLIPRFRNIPCMTCTLSNISQEEIDPTLRNYLFNVTEQCLPPLLPANRCSTSLYRYSGIMRELHQCSIEGPFPLLNVHHINDTNSRHPPRRPVFFSFSGRYPPQSSHDRRILRIDFGPYFSPASLHFELGPPRVFPHFGCTTPEPSWPCSLLPVLYSLSLTASPGTISFFATPPS